FAVSSVLTFGVLAASAPHNRSRDVFELYQLRGNLNKVRWTEVSVKIGNWNAGARLFYRAGSLGVSVDRPKYINCHPDAQSEGSELTKQVSCDFSNPKDCGWFPERQAADVEYNMWHPNSGELNLLQRKVNDSTSLIWRRVGPQGKEWRLGEVQIYSVCTFESGTCGWQLHNWEVTKSSSVTLPLADHSTRAPLGSFAMAKSPGGRMLSPKGWFETTQNRCLRFWFFLAGTGAETLNVTRVLNQNSEEALWFQTANDAPSKAWYSAAVNLTSHEGDVFTVFDGETSGDPGTAVAVDDIALGDTPCPPAGSCSFEEDMCSWYNSKGLAYAQWYRHKGYTVSSLSRLDKDHTLGTKDEAWLNISFVETSGSLSGDHTTVRSKSSISWTLLSVEREDLPYTFSVVITATAGKFVGNVAIDDIYVRSGKCGTASEATTSTATTSDVPEQPSTKKTTVTPDTEEPTTLTKETTETAVTEATPLPTAPSPDCSRGEFNCRDGATCIPALLTCDGVADCPNGLDEKCSVKSVDLCKEDEFYCPTKYPAACLPRVLLCDGHEDCFGSADESLCGVCPEFFCQNNGVCSWTQNKRSPACNCTDGYAGTRCQVLRKTAPKGDEEPLKASSRTGSIVAGILVVLAIGITGAVIAVILLRRKRAIQSSEALLHRAAYDASSERTEFLD
ncbi:hypothetical protein MTO96_036519, partial [Rhipicephalus appendiculatus]